MQTFLNPAEIQRISPARAVTHAQNGG